MAIEVRCDCGKLLRARDELAGRQARCPKCNGIVTIPGPASTPVSVGGLDDLLSEELSSQPAERASDPPPLPKAGSPPRKGKKGWFSWLFWEFPRFGSALKWKEPWCYPLRLRGDVLCRFAVVLAVWIAVSGVFLVAFAISGALFPIALGIASGAIVAGLSLGRVFFGRDHVAGNVRFDENRIYRSRSYIKAFDRGSWTEWSKWPYEAIDHCVIVPGDSIGKLFSVMLVSFGSHWERIGIPQLIDLERLRRHLTAMGVTVEYGTSIPAEFTKPMQWKVPAIIGAIGTVCLLAGLAGYADQAPGPAPQQAKVEEKPHVELEDLDERGIRLKDDVTSFQPGGQMFRDGGEQLPPGSPGRRRGKAASEDKIKGPPQAEPRPTAPAATGTPEERDDLFNSLIGNTAPRTRPHGIAPHAVPGSAPVGPAAPPGHRPPSSSNGFLANPAAASTSSQPGDTELAGGTGGVPFRSENSSRKPVVGFRYELGSWMGRTGPRSLDPLYDRVQTNEANRTIGAREGYAVGAIRVDADQFVTAVQIVFMRLTPNGRLDKTDSYTSDWIGEPSEKSPQTLGGTGAQVLGVYGRKAAVLDAVGLMLQEE